MAEEKKKQSWRASGLLYLVGAGIVVACLLGVSKLKRGRAKQVASQLHQETAASEAGPRVDVVTVGNSSTVSTLTLLGETYPYLESTLYAKVSGYLKSIYVDKGDTVKANQVLVEIESPETDAQYLGAVANARNLSALARRDSNLVKRDMVAKQDAETAVANAKVAEQQMENLSTLKSYEVISAPFAGKITARYVDPGALIQSGSVPVVRLSETDHERVYVYPNQEQAAHLRVGDPAEITDPARPGVEIPARVTRISGEFDVNTRTMLTEIDFYNRRNEIPPGSFVQVTLRFRNHASDLEIPAEALVLRGTGTFVAVVGADDRVTYRPVVVASDDGARVSIRSGLRPGEQIAVNISGNVPDGGRIQPIKTASKRTIQNR